VIARLPGLHRCRPSFWPAMPKSIRLP